VKEKPTLSLVPRQDLDTAWERLVERYESALTVADHVAKRVMAESADPLAVALADNLRQLIALCHREPLA
jgi:hypothetical protein